MKLEATGKSFIYRWPGGEVHLKPGKPIDLPEDRALRLLDKAAGKVRMVPPAIEPGALITWIHNGLVIYGMVDFIHVYGDGNAWAFCTIGESWAAVNLKFAKEVET